MAMIEETEPAEVEPQALDLRAIAEAVNVMDLIDRQQIGRLQSRCQQGFQADQASREDWLKRHKAAMDLALQVTEGKDYPFEGAANVIYPLITTAAIQFAARAYPNIVPGGNIVKARVVGDDSGVFEVTESPEGMQEREVVPAGLKADRGQRIAQFMSWQHLKQMPNWTDDTDVLLHYLPIAGCAFRKTWFERGKPQTKWISAEDFVVHMDTPSLEKAMRKSEVYALEPHQIVEKKNRGEWDAEACDRIYDPEGTETVDFVEMHMRFDLDNDGYPEPYIVHFEKDGGEIVRIVANFGSVELDGETVIAIEPKTYYTKYPFIPNPTGGFYDIGFGWLLGPINRAVNTAINMLFDAGHWQTAPSYFAGKRLRLKAGDTFLRPNEIKPVESFGETIKNELVRVEVGQPSPVLFQLLGLMIEAGRDISSVKDIMMGQSDQNVAPTTALTLVEQGQKSFSAIYKRIHRALCKEMDLLYRRNRENLQALLPIYKEVLDVEDATEDDFAPNFDIMPVTDPELAADGAKLAQAQFIQSLLPLGTLDPLEVTKRSLHAGQVPDSESLLAKERQPDPDTLVKMGKLENDKARIANDTRRMEAEILKMYAEAINELADAEAKEEGTQIAYYKARVDGLKGMMNELGRLQGLAGASGDAGMVQGSGSNPQAAGEPGQAGGVGLQLRPDPGAARGPANGQG